ncbi:MAG: hypothetical protein IPN71_05350 [Fibrobacteres bacterium]|jgi:hypothetical protein|nr:hypothetical protein [Fibrobacterota bacterium]
MDSPLRNPWIASVLAIAAAGFLVWRLLPLFGGSSSSSSDPSPVVQEVPQEVLQGLPVTTTPEVSDSLTLPLSVEQSRDSLGGWETSLTRDPFQSQKTGSAPRAPQRATTSPAMVPSRSGQRPLVRGLATGSANLVLAQGRVLAEGDTFAGGVLRAIRSDRILVRRPTGDTVFFFPRGTLP